MDQLKIGQFIQQQRKEQNLTQSDLAEKLNITDRAISKWERGLCLPDAGTMPLLCEILNISINDLFSGEKVDMKENEKKLEQNLLELMKLKEENDKELLRQEIFISITSIIVFLGSISIAIYAELPLIVNIILIVVSSIIFIYGMGTAMKIEQLAGYYECGKCHHKYIPTFSSVFWAQHMGRTRYMRCPKCNMKSWNKKVISKSIDE